MTVPTALRIGSLCSGAGGLDIAAEHIFGATTAWHCEIDAAASRALAHRYPGVPNHGDFTNTDLGRIAEPVDILTGGYPCQPFSHAGRRKGTNDERHIWPWVRHAIRRVRPRYTFLENVAGHRSLGFDRVLGDLAEDGMHVRWTSVRASDVGAPHRRERLFILAYPADQSPPIPTSYDAAALDSAWAGADDRDAAGDTSARVRELGRGAGGSADTSAVGALLPTPAASRSGRNQSPSPGAAVRPSLDMITDLLPTPTTQDGANCAGPSQFERNTVPLNAAVTLLQTPSVADALGGHLTRSGTRKDEPLLPGQAQQMASGWGKYAGAVRRWETIAGPPPSPTEPNSKGNPRLNPAFSEWMMGWPAGWVTAVPGISRNDQLRIIGNGVVPQAAAFALRWLLSLELAA